MSHSLRPHEPQHARHPIINTRSPPKPMFIESVMPSNHLILCYPLLLLPSIFPSIRIFSKEAALHIRWPKCWSFSFSISPSNEHPGLISFRMDWLDLLAVQGTLKSLLQHHSSKASNLWHSAFFIVQLLHPYMTTGSLQLRETVEHPVDTFGLPSFTSTAMPSLLVALPSSSLTFFYRLPSKANWSTLMSTDLTASLQQLHVLEILLIHISSS